MLKLHNHTTYDAESEATVRDQINSIVIDYFLWDYAKDHSAEMEHIPIHRTRCIFY